MAEEPNLLPTDWDDNDRMNFMFSAFPERREVNPKHWDSKLHFWSKAIVEGCKFRGDICIDLATLKRRFSRNGLTPLGLGIVIREMLQRGKLERKEDFLNCGTEGWLSWSYGLAKKSVRWSVGTLWSGSGEPVNLNEQFVLVDEAKENAEWILKRHYERVECETTDHIIPWNVLKTREKFDEQTLAVLIASLQKQSKAVVFTTGEGEKIVKFAKRGETSVSLVSDSDVEIVRLKKTLAILTLQINKLSNEVEKCRLQAASLVKEGARPKALKLLKRKDLRQKTLDKTIANLSSLEEILHRIQSAHTNKTVIEALKLGTVLLKHMHGEISVESVGDVMDEVNESLNVSQDIDSAIIRGSSRVDETSGIGSNELAELEQELERLATEDAVAIQQVASPHRRLPSGISSMGGQHSNSPLSRQMQSTVKEYDKDRELEAINWPAVPSLSPNKTGTSKTRDETSLLS